LTGTSNQPVTIQLPDLNVLAAQAKPTLGVGFAKPAGSLKISGDSTGKPQNPGRSTLPEICFFPIPLITIVAMFVFELFLPVVMLIFQLWWMLALKFCILPELSLAGGVTAELAIDASVDIGVQANVDAALIGAFGADVANSLTSQYSPPALVNLDFDVNKAGTPGSGMNPSPGGIRRDGAGTTGGAVADLYEPEVTHV
jgi:hypothetical protein